MKKIFALVLAIALAAALLAGCAPTTGTNNPGDGTNTPSTPQTPAEPQTPAGDAGAVKTGLAINTSVAKSADPGEKDGLVQADSIIVGVTVGEDGKIIACAIDSAQTKVNFGKDGKIITPLDSEFKTKNELGAEYGMAKASSIGKEWYEQAAALAEYVVGKTADEVKGIAVDQSGYTTDADLKASVTISISGYIDTIAKAVANAVELGASASDKLSLGTVTNIARSNDAGAEEGLIQVYSTFTAITTGDGDKITSCVIDAVQSNVNFDASGKITTDLSVAPQTKNEIKEGYGLKKASSIGKEWYEQAAAFAQYVIGKTANEVEAIAVDDAGHTTDADLKASVTIGIADFQDVIAKAAK